MQRIELQNRFLSSLGQSISPNDSEAFEDLNLLKAYYQWCTFRNPDDYIESCNQLNFKISESERQSIYFMWAALDSMSNEERFNIVESLIQNLCSKTDGVL